MSVFCDDGVGHYILKYDTSRDLKTLPGKEGKDMVHNTLTSTSESALEEISNSLQYATHDGDKWTEPHTVVEGETWFVNWTETKWPG